MRLIKTRYFRTLIVIVSLLLVVSMSKSIYNLWKKKDIVRERRAELENLKAENITLQQQLKEAQSPEFIEKQAREKLGLLKEGETIVLMPNDKTQMTNGETRENLPIWKKWWRLFF